RLATDAPNTLGQSESSLVEGTGFQCCTFSNGSLNDRWGDYSAMTIDPDGCTFWYTNEYYDTQPTSLAADNWKTRFPSFRFRACQLGAAGGVRAAGGGAGGVDRQRLVEQRSDRVRVQVAALRQQRRRLHRHRRRDRPVVHGGAGRSRFDASRGSDGVECRRIG